MARIDWDDSLSVGVSLIDEQHKMLIQKLSDLSDALVEGRESNKIRQGQGESRKYHSINHAQLLIPHFIAQKFKMKLKIVICSFKGGRRNNSR